MDYRTEASNQEVRLHSREVTEAKTEQRGADSRQTGGIKKGGQSEKLRGAAEELGMRLEEAD